MNRKKLIKDIWEFGMKHPNFPIEELKEWLMKKKDCKYLWLRDKYTEEDISFGIAYVKKNYYKNQDLDEYLIDQDSISNNISLTQNRIAIRSIIVSMFALIVSFLSLVLTSFDRFPALFKRFTGDIERIPTKEATVPREEFNQEDTCQAVFVLRDSLAT